MAVISLVDVLAFQPLLAAAAHRKASASAKIMMGGLGSIVRTVDLVIRKLIFCFPKSVLRRYAAKRKEATKIHSATSGHRNKKTFSFMSLRFPNLAAEWFPRSNATENLWSPAASNRSRMGVKARNHQLFFTSTVRFTHLPWQQPSAG